MTSLPPRPTHNFFPLRFSPPQVRTAAERRYMIQLAAYYRAERRGFAPGNSDEDWAIAEAEIDGLIARELAQASYINW